MNYYESIVEKTGERALELEQQINSFDFEKIEPMISKSLIDHQSLFEEVKDIFNNQRINPDDKQNKLYNILIKHVCLIYLNNIYYGQIYENKRLSREIDSFNNKIC